VARALEREGARRGIPLALLLATTSEAYQLGSERLAVVRLPAPVSARRAGLRDAERRRIVGAALESVTDAFAPDLMVVDTFPSGPHGELTRLVSSRAARPRAKRAIVRRSVPAECAEDPTLTRGLDGYDLAILAADPFRDETLRLPVPIVHVPPVTMFEPEDAEGREAARARLGLPRDARLVLIASGGGGDPEAVRRAEWIAETLARVAPEVVPVLAEGPLVAPVRPLSPALPRRGREESRPLLSGLTRRGREVRLHVAPMQPWLAAFDGAIAAGGYNTAHELVKARVPCALFAQPRPFDDQASRVARFAAASFSFALERFDEAALGEAIAWMERAPRVTLPSGGADGAARALLDLACEGAA